MTRRPKSVIRKVSLNQIRRSVASSSAIETGESSKLIEARLKARKRRFPDLLLAR
ncbi:hypothetical protein [Microbulbifer rhizosphaerae]|uniref:Uncharacterized protein n=1 Tax=Microbulbifer rhizosphaerae TaxID=1562603 RepID=A0A7W4WB97_9GAMM|nr:hypothetical protein [Microbulbifer rhizosphaerae]MBB3061083.1 hypothetical protein [Microbulbifer rhizosphaerae]